MMLLRMDMDSQEVQMGSSNSKKDRKEKDCLREGMCEMGGERRKERRQE